MDDNQKFNNIFLNYFLLFSKIILKNNYKNN